MIYRYQIVNNEIVEITYDQNGKQTKTPTGAKAFYTKKEIAERYKWGGDLMRKNLLEIGDKIYDTDSNGNLITSKRVFSPKEITIILDYFGLP